MDGCGKYSGARGLYERKRCEMRRSSCLVESLWPFAYLWHNALLVDKCLNVYGVLSFIFENTYLHISIYVLVAKYIPFNSSCHSVNTRLSCFSQNLSASTRICRCDNVLHLKRKVNCPRLSVLETRLGVLCYHQRVLVPSAKTPTIDWLQELQL